MRWNGRASIPLVYQACPERVATVGADAPPGKAQILLQESGPGGVVPNRAVDFQDRRVLVLNARVGRPKTLSKVRREP
jgi:hypothetical protein